jgi:hypothetical protein
VTVDVRSTAAILLLVAAASLPAAARSQATSLVASVTPEALRLTDAAGVPVTHLTPGTYAVTVEDRSPIHNVHLEGPGVSQHSGLAFEGTTAWTVELRDGVYSLVSDPQADSLALVVVVGSPPDPRLFARVTDTEIALELADGTDVRELEPGTYAIRVEDRSRAESFRLVGPGVEQHTQRHVPFATTWQVALGDGMYHFFSDRRPVALHGSFQVGSPPPPSEPTRALRAITGSDFAIALVDATSAPVERLEPGTYTIRVDDRSPDHNFRISGPGVNAATSLAEVGSRELTVRLRGGTYSFFCDPHTLTMLGEFRVPQSRVAVRRLLGALTADGRATMRGASGAPVRVITAGEYAIVVSDRSPTKGFRLTGPGVRRATAARFRGTVTWRVRLVRGTYRYGAGRALRSFRVR